MLDRPAEAVARLTIRNPGKRNALDHEILDGIATTMDALDDGIETRCVIITGSEGMFSAGYDIGDIPDEVFAEEAERLVAHPFSRAIEAVERFPFPTLAAVNGHALGGGLELARHLRPARRRRRVQARHAARQARPDLQPHRHPEVPRHGRPGAHARAVLHRPQLSAERAEQIGLVHEAVRARTSSSTRWSSPPRSPATPRSH